MHSAPSFSSLSPNPSFGSPIRHKNRNQNSNCLFKVLIFVFATNTRSYFNMKPQNTSSYHYSKKKPINIHQKPPLPTHHWLAAWLYFRLHHRLSHPNRHQYRTNCRTSTSSDWARGARASLCLLEFWPNCSGRRPKNCDYGLILWLLWRKMMSHSVCRSRKRHQRMVASKIR